MLLLFSWDIFNRETILLTQLKQVIFYLNINKITTERYFRCDGRVDPSGTRVKKLRQDGYWQVHI